MTLRRPDNTTFSASLTTATYTHNPVLAYKVVTAGTKKVGYLAFISYTTLSSAQAAINAAFTEFTTQGVTELVVDLRYNGGGYTSTSEYLNNMIVPASANGKTMYVAYYNNFLVNNPVTLLRNQWRRDANGKAYNYDQLDFSIDGNTKKFNKQGTLNLSRVFFLVTGSTASSSELTINSLRPHMDVQIIGSTTFGKPVGFFDIKINKYEMYLAEFETKNSAGEGRYYLGMTPGSAQYPGKLSNDDYTRDFGDVNDLMFAQALAYINNGKYNSDNTRIESTGTNAISIAAQTEFNQLINPYKLNGMLTERTSLNK
jgi:carboxyl-terminal processing protease